MIFLKFISISNQFFLMYLKLITLHFQFTIFVRKGEGGLEVSYLRVYPKFWQFKWDVCFLNILYTNNYMKQTVRLDFVMWLVEISWNLMAWYRWYNSEWRTTLTAENIHHYPRFINDRLQHESWDSMLLFSCFILCVMWV